VTLLFWLAGGIVANQIVGCLVLASIDTDDLELLDWIQSAPTPALRLLPVTAWPVTAWFYVRLRE
jgi:hypothetical protein